MLPALANLATPLKQLHGIPQVVIAQDVSQCVVEKDQWNDLVVIRLVTLEGVPHTFAVAPQNALNIAGQLKSEVEKPHQVGTA